MQLHDDHIWPLYQKRDVATLSAIVHPGVNYLDLSVCEYTGHRLKMTATKSTVRRLIVPDTMAKVGALNLDSPQHFDGKLQILDGMKTQRPEYCPFFVDSICVVSSVYTRKFDLDIVERVEESRNKMNDLRKYLKAAKTMKLRMEGFEARFCECFLDVLVKEQCEDSELLMEFVELCDCNLRTWLLQVRNERLLDYVLCHTQRLRFDIFKEISASSVSISILSGVVWNIQALLKYGFPTDFPSETKAIYRPFGVKLRTNEIRSARVSISKSKSRYRLVLLLHLIHFYVYNIDSQATAKSMRMLWRAIPASFLDRQEVMNFFKGESSDDHFAACQDYLGGMWAFYQGVLGKERDFRPQEPRKLAHLCRCTVRSALGRNFALPGGVDTLGLPQGLVSYLKLEH